MTHWLIAKTDPNKEFAVAQALTDLGHTVWVPTLIAVKRKSVSVGPGISLRRREAIERPLMPSVVFVGFATWNDARPLARHLQGFWTNSLDYRVLVPEIQVTRFRERVDAVNAAEIARIKKSQMGKRKSKRTLKFDPNLADELKSLLFGSKEMEAV